MFYLWEEKWPRASAHSMVRLGTRQMRNPVSVSCGVGVGSWVSCEVPSLGLLCFGLRGRSKSTALLLVLHVKNRSYQRKTDYFNSSYNKEHLIVTEMLIKMVSNTICFIFSILFWQPGFTILNALLMTAASLGRVQPHIAIHLWVCKVIFKKVIKNRGWEPPWVLAGASGWLTKGDEGFRQRVLLKLQAAPSLSVYTATWLYT